MKSNTLRTGNLLLFDNRVTEIDAKDILMMEMPHSTRAEHYSPIPLDEDFLLSWGFVKYEHVYELYVGTFCVSVTIINDSVVVFLEEQRILMQYVHEMQNLCVLLTGKEIEVKILSETFQESSLR